MLRTLFCLLMACLSVHPAWASLLPRPVPPVFRVPLAPNDQPIRLEHVAINAEISGSMAATTVRMVFRNPNHRVMEGNLEFPLLDGQQVIGFGLDFNGVMRAAVPVEKAKGRQVFDEIERRGVDPALLEVTQGNNFKVRVYPLPARGTRTVELRYIEHLQTSGARWLHRLPLAFGKVGRLDVEVRFHGISDVPAMHGGVLKPTFDISMTGQRATLRLNDTNVSDLLTFALPAQREARAWRQQMGQERYFLAEMAVDTQAVPRPRPRVITLLWDSSASGAQRNLQGELEVLGQYLRAIGDVEVRLIRLRDRAEAPQRFSVRRGDWNALRQALERTTYDGATALGGWPVQRDSDLVLLVSDGLANYGAAFPALPAGQRLLALSSSARADVGWLAALAAKHGGNATVLDAEHLEQAVHALLHQPPAVANLVARGAADLQVDTAALAEGMLRVAGRLTAAQASVTLDLTQAGQTRPIAFKIDGQTAPHPVAAYQWARLRLHALESNRDLHVSEIGRLGKQFGIPTRETSLIVLETAADYARYEIEPPDELRAEYLQVRDSVLRRRKQSAGEHFENVVRQYRSRIDWWNDPVPVQGAGSGQPPMGKGLIRRRQAATSVKPQVLVDGIVAEDMGPMPPPPPAPMAPVSAPPPVLARTAAPSREQDAVMVTGQRAAAAPLQLAARPEAAAGAARFKAMDNGDARGAGHAPGAISLRRWTPDAPYLKRMKNAKRDDLYAIYLDERPSYANSSAFYLDVADRLLDAGERELGLRVLSNLAELELENRALLRILGYRLIQAGEPALAVPVFQKVVKLAEEEPQSFRDLGLALASAGEHQQAIDTLYEVATRPWDARFPDIESVSLAEMNAIIATSPKRLDTSRIDPRVLKNLPLDARVVLTWDADNTDIDLWMTEPSGEQCYYGQSRTRQGARMTRDFTGGYGPEEYALRHATPGKYRIEAHFFGHRQQVLAGATTIQAKVVTGFGTRHQKERLITLRLKDRNERVLVGEFEIGR